MNEQAVAMMELTKLNELLHSLLPIQTSLGKQKLPEPSLCENALIKLKSYVDGKEDSKEKVRFFFEDKREVISTKDTIKIITEKESYLPMLYKVGMQKLFFYDLLSPGDKNDINALIKHGLINTLSVTDASNESNDFVTLTTKGWTVFSRRSVYDEIKEENKQFLIPDGLRFSPDGWTVEIVSKLVLLLRYCRTLGKSNDFFIGFFDKENTKPYLCEIAGDSELSYLIPMITNGKSETELMTSLIRCEDISKICIVTTEQCKKSFEKEYTEYNNKKIIWNVTGSEL